jgi:hypothetical protein
LLSAAVSFAGDNKKESKKEAKKENCSKESSCCAKKAAKTEEAKAEDKLANKKPVLSGERVQLSDSRELSHEEMKSIEKRIK